MNEFYSPEEVLAACDARNVFGHSRGRALAMFVESGKLQGILADYGISDPVEDFRRMARKISYSDTSGIDCSSFDFHAVDSGVQHSSDSGFPLEIQEGMAAAGPAVIESRAACAPPTAGLQGR
jgi:hypothetical protein